MNNTTRHPTDLEPLHSALAIIGLDDLLTGYIARARIGVRYNEISRVAAQFGLEFRHRDNNIYSALKLEPIDNTPTPVTRLITRLDHAAIHGSRRAA